MVASVVLAAGLCVLSGLFASLLGQTGSERPAVFWALAASLPLGAMSVAPAAMMRRSLQFREISIGSLLGVAVGGVCGVLIAIGGQDVWALVGFQVVRTLVSSTYVLAASQWKPRLRFAGSRLRRLLLESGFFPGQGLGVRLIDEAPKLIIGAMLGPAVTGLYIVARRLMEMVSETVVAPFLAIAMPALATATDDPARAADIYRRFSVAACLVGFPALAGLAAVAPEAVLLAYGPNWTSAAAPAALMLLMGFERPAAIFATGSLNAAGRAGLVLALTLPSACLAAALAALFAPFGLLAAVFGLMIGDVLMLPVLFWLAARHTHVKPESILGSLALLAAGALTMAALVRSFMDSSVAPENAVLRLIIGVIMGVVLYGAFAATAARHLTAEALAILSALRWPRTANG
jgi:O-antigen/teichoic acid export membrane protein